MPQAVPIVVPQYAQQVQPVNPLDSVGKALGIVGAAQNIQAGNVGLQEKQQQLKDDQDLRSAAQQAGGDPDKIYDLLSTSNPRAAALWGKQLSERRKADADTAKQHLENLTTQNNMMGQAANAITDPSSFDQQTGRLRSQFGPQVDAYFGKTYDKARIEQIRNAFMSDKDFLEKQQNAITNSRLAHEQDLKDEEQEQKAKEQWQKTFAWAMLTPKNQQQFDAQRQFLKSQVPAKYAEPFLNLFGDIYDENTGTKAKALLSPEELKNLTETRVKEAEIGTMPPDAGAAKKQMSAIFDGQSDPRYKNYAGQIDALGDNPAPKALDDLVKEARKEAGQTRTAVTTAKATEPIKIEMAGAEEKAKADAQATKTGPGDWTKTGDDFLATIPAAWRTTVSKIAKYDEDPAKVTSMRGGMREQVMQWVNQVNPEYDSTLFTNRAPTRKAFTTGTQGQQINSINTAIGHIDQITRLGANLNNSQFVPGNQLYNWARTTFGADAVTNFDTLKDALAGEVSSVLSKGGATVSGIADAKDKIKAASSPAQLAGYVKTLLPIMGSKLNALDYQYHQAMGANDPFSALSPESKNILKKHGFNPDDILGNSNTGPKVGDIVTVKGQKIKVTAVNPDGTISGVPQ